MKKQRRLPAAFPPMRQMDLFSFAIEDERYSHTIHLYDAIPKYVRGARAGLPLAPLDREFSFGGKMFRVTITPARIQNEKGEYQDVFPGDREELVEDALRKMATDGKHGCNLDGMASVVFSINELFRELKSRGHTFSKKEIIDALQVCNKTHLKIATADGRSVLSSSIFETVGMHTRKDWEEAGGAISCFVRFNILVTKSIRDCTFRQYDYLTCMAYQRSLSRYLHKRLAHAFLQASFKTSYTIRATTVLRDSGSRIYASLSNNIREIKRALDEMVEKEVVAAYEVINIKNGRKVVDAEISIRTNHKFNADVKRANALSRTIVADEKLSVIPYK